MATGQECALSRETQRDIPHRLQGLEQSNSVQGNRQRVFQDSSLVVLDFIIWVGAANE